MDLIMGTVSSYIKSMEIQNKWQMKKLSGDFRSDEKKLTELQIKNEQFKKTYKEMQENDTNDETLSTIHSKIYAGSQLTAEEMRYLQAKDPMTYQKVRNLELEKKQYERELRECKTKEDVQKLKISKVTASLSAINAVKDNPNIPESQKVAIAMQEQKRIDALEKIAVKFVKSGEYSKLPDESELLKAEQDIRESEREQNNIKKDEIKTDDEEKTESYEIQDIVSVNEEEKDIKTDNEMTKIEAEQTPEARKMKKAKSKYQLIIQQDIPTDEIFISIGQQYNLKV